MNKTPGRPDARTAAVGGLVVLLGVWASGRPAVAQDTAQGRAVYEQWCAGCHGESGAGDGEAARYMLPRPRDFRGAIYQIRTTASGGLPTDDDIMRAINEGLPGTAMPGWRDRLSERDRRDLVAYLKTFSDFFADTTFRPEPLDFGGAPGGAGSEEALRVGRQFYDTIQCWKCHGQRGRGDGPSAPTLEDDAGQPIFAADLTQNWLFNGGGTVEDIYRRLRTGLDGTPMPAFDTTVATTEQVWRLAQYVRSLSPDQPPDLRDVIHAPRVDGALPRGPNDSAWNQVDPYWFPLVGQIIAQDRWFAPAVRGVWVQAAHTGDSLALRLVWNDRSQSPDTAWLAHARRVLAAMAGDAEVTAPELWPDQVAVQFPLTIPAGMERPYFLMGSRTDPVYQWRWSSAAPERAVAGLARGLARFEA
ncbi:MAG: c-type cytochrome, partial [Gemmatimonadales bacterium]